MPEVTSIGRAQHPLRAVPTPQAQSDKPATTSEAENRRPPAAPSSSGGRDRRRLIGHLGAALIELSADASFREDVVTPAILLAASLLQDTSPTPQASHGPDGGVTIQWLVNGSSLTVDVMSESDIHAWAEDANGTELFDFEFTSRWTVADAEIVAMRQFLKELSMSIAHPISLRRVP